MTDPPLFEGSFHDTVTWPSPATPITLVGASGAVGLGVAVKVDLTVQRGLLAFVFHSNLI